MADSPANYDVEFESNSGASIGIAFGNTSSSIAYTTPVRLYQSSLFPAQTHSTFKFFFFFFEITNRDYHH
jgi:hypothetical protein